jgi:YidC/Oxa1 family membrane protein insertase
VDKRTIAAIVLIGLILILTNTSWYRYLVGVPQTQQKEEQAIAPQEEVVSERQETPGEMPAPEEEDRTPRQQPKETDDQTLLGIDSGTQVKARAVRVRSPLFQGTIETRGGVLTSWRIKPKKRNPEEQEWVPLLPADVTSGALGLVLRLTDGRIRLDDLVFQPSVDSLVLSSGRPEGTITLTAETDRGFRVEKIFEFRHDRHDFELRIVIDGADILDDVRGYTLWWRPGLPTTEENYKDDLNSFAAHTKMGDVIEKTGIKGETIEDSSFTGDTRWLAIQTKYFLMAMIPPQGKDGVGAELRGSYRKEDEDKGIRERKLISGGILMDLDDGRCDHSWTVYVGPMDYFTLKDMGVGLERTVYLGRWVLRWIGKVILYAFVTIHKVIPNYGLVIIIFSILVKGLFYPLTKKSIASIRKMQELQPEIKKLQEKYKKDPAKLQKATMEMYRKYNVNPASGCFPLLLQMPVFFAMYAVFRNTIELRGASFLWIDDLSAPDTIVRLSSKIPLYGDKVNLLPFIMAITMFIQQKKSMKDPKQAMMVYIMPIFLFFIFNNISSGLVLYWTMFNLLQLLQESIHPHKPTVVSSEEETND